MIYTITLNPSLDYFMEFDQPISKDLTNRSTLEYFVAGGKGINISMVLSNIGISSRALGFVGGFTKDIFLTLLQKYPLLQPQFNYVENHTRINIKANHNKEIMELNAAGPVISCDAQDGLLERIKRINQEDIVIISGHIQEQLRDYIENIVQYLHETGISFVIDTDKIMLKRLIKYQPLLVKPNLEEINQYFNTDQINNQNII